MIHNINSVPSKYSGFTSLGAMLISKKDTAEYLVAAGSNIIADIMIEGTIFQLMLKNESGRRCALADTNAMYLGSV